MLTRAATQRLTPAQGEAIAALNSVYLLFPHTRDIIKKKGRHCINFAKIAVAALGQLVRPFTTESHGRLATNPSLTEDKLAEFRVELLCLQTELQKSAHLLTDIAGAEDLTDIYTARTSATLIAGQ